MANPIFTETNPRISVLPGLDRDYSSREARQALASIDAAKLVGNTLTITNPVAPITSTEILAANTERQELIIQNIGSTNVFLNFGSAAALTNGYLLQPGDEFNSNNYLLVQSSIEVISDTSPSQLYIIETALT